MESAGRLGISAGSLNNHQGTVVSDGLSVTLDGALDNTSGRLLSQKTLSVAGSVKNPLFPSESVYPCGLTGSVPISAVCRHLSCHHYC